MMFYSIRAKILALGLATLALVGTSFLAYSIITTANFKTLHLDVIEKTIAYETEKVNKIITEIEHEAGFFSVLGMLCYKAGSQQFGKELVIENLTNFPVLIGGGFWFEPYAFKKDILRSGFYAFRDRGSGEILTEDNLFMKDYEYHETSWYKEILNGATKPGQVVWTRPYVDDSGTFSLMTTAGSGIFNDDGTLIAITTADWQINEVVKELIALKPTENSFVILCVPEKDYVISSTRTNELTGLSMDSIPWDITSSSFTYNDTNYLRFGKYMNNGWLLSIQIPENEIFAAVESRNERFSIAVVIVTSLLFIRL